jgi:hypothetical protein
MIGWLLKLLLGPVTEDPDRLGYVRAYSAGAYRVKNELLEIMPASEWLEIERKALL